ncbi:hypothetical protein EYF80_053951 [Liparis tanakae]|uniref:Uncharacterized protein n=1 Tax=Liparis tanakae TaxID=230148 RepID=A0A4Z2F3T0_9TELE|nr:hypothetical protein EYF80_053951 [Liparis tanakae]
MCSSWLCEDPSCVRDTRRPPAGRPPTPRRLVREQLEHLQSSPLTSARHMAGPCEGWVLSPGKVLTHRQERRATLTPRGRGGNS